jgi:hypothetical protein
MTDPYERSAIAQESGCRGMVIGGILSSFIWGLLFLCLWMVL